MYAAAARTRVIFADGPLAPKGSSMKATQLSLVAATIQGTPRIILEDEDGAAVMEITSARVASARMESKAFDPTAVVEVRARSDEGALVDENGRPIFFVVGGPKKVLKRAFSSIGIAL